MENPPPLAGLDPADLLRQGAADDTLVDGASVGFVPPPLEEIAAVFPQFDILELIGQGGMGAVYKVRQKDLDRIVALKILPPGIGQSLEFSGRFTREARALAKLNHPGIVTLHEFGQQDGLYFILMEFVDGVNLAQLMKTGRVSPREALAIVPQICDALQYAHDQGIVHRDIKPENILLDRQGRVKVADFGIAKVVAAVCDPISSGDTPVPENQTLAGKIIGTPQYMAPEQIEHPSDVDHRADIYALGVVFYQMLTGELPGKDMQAPSTKVSIDVRLDEMVLRALEEKPERRYQTALEFRTVLDGLPPATPPPVPKRGMMRRWWWVFLVMIPLGMLLGFVAAGVVTYVIPKKYEAEAIVEVVPANGSAITTAFLGNQLQAIRSSAALTAVSQELELPNKWMTDVETTVSILKGIISTQNIRGTDLIAIKVRHTNREDAVGITNAVIRNYQRSFGGKVIIHETPLQPRMPVSPNVTLNLMLGIAAGLMLSPLMALMLIPLLHRVFPEKRPATEGRISKAEFQNTDGTSRKGAVAQSITTPENMPSPPRWKKTKWIVAACLAAGVLWFALRSLGRHYPESSLSSAYKSPVIGRIEFKYIHPDSEGGNTVFYPVKKWGDTQWFPRQQTRFRLKGDRTLQVKTRVNATRPDAPVAQVTTSSGDSHWETQELKINGMSPLQHMVFSNGLRVEILWSPVAPSLENSEPPDPRQLLAMQQASKRSDEMHPVSPSMTIQGAVAIPGVFPIDNPASLLDAIAAAGGWTGNADLRKIQIKMPGATGAQVHDLNAILKGEAVNPVITPDSIIEIPEE